MNKCRPLNDALSSKTRDRTSVFFFFFFTHVTYQFLYHSDDNIVADEPDECRWAMQSAAETNEFIQYIERQEHVNVKPCRWHS